MERSILLLGASIRAAAQSCRRAGFDIRGADLFADRDTQAMGAVRPIADFPDDFLKFALRGPADPWMYTGGLENYPELVEEISRRRQLWGVGGAELRLVRDPIALHHALCRAGLPTPPTHRRRSACTADRLWLRKPLRSCGGTGIKMLQDIFDVPSGSERESESSYQAHIDGWPAAPVLLGYRDDAEFVGATRQLVGTEWGAATFQYAGSIGPLDLGARCTTQFKNVGRVLGREFGLRGIFGVDGIVREGKFWTVEVNPRYTASVEVLERAGAAPLIARHAAVFGGFSEPGRALPFNQPAPRVAKWERVHGKAIVFADRDLQVGDRLTRYADRQNRDAPWPRIADIPTAGQKIGRGRPVATVFAAAADEAAALATLRSRCTALRRIVELP